MDRKAGDWTWHFTLRLSRYSSAFGGALWQWKAKESMKAVIRQFSPNVEVRSSLCASYKKNMTVSRMQLNRTIVSFILVFLVGGVYAPAECNPTECCASQPGWQIKNPQQSMDPSPTTSRSRIQTWQHVWLTGKHSHTHSHTQAWWGAVQILSKVIVWPYIFFNLLTPLPSLSLCFSGGDSWGGAVGWGSGQSSLRLLSLRSGPLLLWAVRRGDQWQTAQLSGSTLHCLPAAIQRLYSG